MKNIQYEIHTWNICGDLKIIALLFGLQLGYTKFCCFLYEWDSTDRKHHFIQQRWSIRESLIPGQKNVVNTPFINPEKFIYLRCASDFDSINFAKQWIKIALYLKSKFPRTSDAEFKEGGFVGPQIRELVQDVKCEDQLSGKKQLENYLEKYQFWGKSYKVENCCVIVADLLQSYKAMGCTMSLRAYFLECHFFPENLGQ